MDLDLLIGDGFLDKHPTLFATILNKFLGCESQNINVKTAEL